MPTTSDFTPTGLCLEGPYENDRNGENSDLYKAIIREAFGVKDVICGHHLVYEIEDKRADGFAYQIIEEIPSADTLIFDHAVAKRLWGDAWQANLTALALTPVKDGARDKLLGDLYRNRPFPITVIGDAGHPEAQAQAVATLKAKAGMV